MAHEEHAIEMLEQAIVEYLRAHPHAADSVEGIRNWWLSSDQHAASTDLVERALGRLADRRIVKAERSMAGRLIYSAGSTRRPDRNDATARPSTRVPPAEPKRR